MRNVTKVRFSGHSATAEPLYQYDYGQVLSFCGVDLPDSYEVHFAKEGDAQTVSVLGDSSGVLIPDMYLTTAKTVYAWLFLHEGEDDGETEYKVTIPVLARPEPSETQPTPVQQDIITQAIAAMQAAQTEFDAMATADGAEAGKVLTVKTVVDGTVIEWEFTEGGGGGGTGDYTDLTNKPKINNVTLSGNKTGSDLGLVSNISATKTGDTTTIYSDGVAIATVKDGTDGQDGEDGYSPSASVSKSGDTAAISITDKDGTTTATITDGQDGQDGYSPTASVSKSGTTATITITDKNGTTTAQISDGTDGQDGNDGYSPTATVSKSGSTATISITDKNGTTTAQVSDGTDGQDGSDGITPTTTVTAITGGHNVAFGYGTGDSRNTDFDVMDGTDGTTPVKGVDYWTAQDQAEIVDDVVDEVSPTMQTKAITDTGGYYTTDTVEGALQEIGAEIAGVNALIGTGVIS